MKKMRKYVLLLLAGLMLWGLGESQVAAAAEETTEQTTVEIAVPLESEWPEQEELITGYLESVLYDSGQDEIVMYGNQGDHRLTNLYEKEIYRALKNSAASIAEGKMTSTQLTVNVSFTWTASELGVDRIHGGNVQDLALGKFSESVNISKILEYLLMDCPYELYWYDKTESTYTSLSMNYSDKYVAIPNLQIKMPVAKEFQNGHIYSMNPAFSQNAKQTKARAEAIVAENSGLPEYEKLVAYKDEICALADYNFSLTESSLYGNPWQILWVFDGDESTKVVCEGYSKAFQYLCQLSGLKCYTVHGVLSNGRESEAHMWNIVTLRGRNYLADITNCDHGAAGYPDELFLVGSDQGNPDMGYYFSIGQQIGYFYENSMAETLGTSVLHLASKNYTDIVNSSLVEDVFLDVYEGEWFKDYVQYVYDKELMSGSNYLFKPNGAVTRAMVVTTLYRMSGSPEVNDRSAVEIFHDIQEGNWYTDAVCWAYNSEITTGNPNTMTFNANTPVTREQMATFFFRYAQYMGLDVSERGDISGMLHADQVKPYSMDAVCWAVGTGLISGSNVTMPDGQIGKDLAPQSGATRAQLAAILQRFCEGFEL